MTRPVLRTPALTLAVAAGLLLTGACSSSSQQGGSRSADKVSVITGEVASTFRSPSVLAGTDDLNIETIDDQSLQIRAAWPAIPGAEPLTKAFGRYAEKEVAAYRKDYGGSTGGVAPTELSINWQLAGADDKMLGLIADEYLFPGASGYSGWRSFWYDVEDREVLSNDDLIADSATLNTTVLDALREKQDKKLGKDIEQTVRKGPDVVAFTTDGDLRVGFDEGKVSSASDGRVSVQIPRVRAAALLSASGRAAQDAARDTRTPNYPTEKSEVTSTPSASETATPDPTKKSVDCTVKKCIALTYDDGPAGYTEELLATLKKEKVPATFFMLGQQAAAFPDVVKAVQADGHEIGSHSYSHKSQTLLSPAQQKEDLTKTLDQLEKITGTRPTMNRPPYGATDETFRATQKKAGNAEILWTIDTLDWKSRNSEAVTRAVLDKAKAGDIVLMHDIHPTTVKAAPAVIRGLKERGFTMVTVSQLLGETTPGTSYSSRD